MNTATLQSPLPYSIDFFTGEARRVEMTGEAYFEGAKNSDRPFPVVYNQTIVEVLGTHFNVNSYAAEQDSRVTLLEGSVRVKKTVLSPGQQSIQTGAGGLRVADANTALATAWVNGYFQFDRADVKTILRQVGR